MRISNIVLCKIITMEMKSTLSLLILQQTPTVWINYVQLIAFIMLKVSVLHLSFYSTRRHVDSRRMKNSTVFQFSEKYVAVKMIWLFSILILLLRLDNCTACTMQPQIRSNIHLSNKSQIYRQGSRLILPTGRTCATNFLSWSHEHIIWSQFFFNKTFD